MSRSETLFANAQKHIPGGVNSPVRAFKSVGGTPLFFKHAEGAYVTDEDDKRYVDYVGSWGPMILGHSHPDVLDAVRAQLEHGLSYGAPTAMETEMADLVCSIVPSMEMVRMVSSGTEATMSAIRLARGFTGRDNILKFEGCYHGHSDSLLVKAGSGLLTQGVPSSAGVPADFAKHTLTTEFNNIDAVAQLLSEVGDTVACIIVEPVAGNMNCVPPAPGFLEGLRSLCDQHGVVLIFDEVMTGFRVALGGAQAHYGVTPDLSTFGKIIGGGMPVGCFGGKREIMQHIAPLGPVYQAGTLSGNPLAVLAGILLFVAWNMGEWHEFVRLKHFSNHYRLLMLGTFFLTVVFDLTVAVEVGLVLACALFVRRMSELFRADPLPQEGSTPPAPARLAWRLHGALFFGAASKVDPLVQAVEAAPRGVAVQFDARDLFALDTTGLEGLEQILKAVGQRGGVLEFVHLQEQPRSLMQRSGFSARLAQQNAAQAAGAAASPPAPDPSSAGTPG